MEEIMGQSEKQKEKAESEKEEETDKDEDSVTESIKIFVLKNISYMVRNHF